MPAKRGKRRRRRKEADIDGWLDKYGSELAQYLGLDLLGLNDKEIKEVLRKPVELVYGSPSSRPNAETIAKRFKRYYENLSPLIASAILEVRKELTRDQLEFVVNNIGRAILAYAPRIYKEIVKHGAHDLLDIARRLWVNHWMMTKTKTPPAECPNCGFNALMPDLTCLVCGASVSERKLKAYLRLEDQIKELVKTLSNDELREFYNKGYVLVNGLGIKPPTEFRERIDIEIHLSSHEKSLIKEEMKRRGML